MDGTRDKDLSMLHKRFNDVSLPLYKRREAHLRFQGIQAQVKDRKLVELRHRLVKAIKAEDVVYIQRFQQMIEDHSRKQWWYNKKV